MKLAFLFLFLGLSMACKSRKEGSEPLVQPAISSELITLQTFPCRGYCPVFTITVRHNGLLEYNGERFVQKTGPATAQLTPTELARLRIEVTKTNLWEYPDQIKSQIMDAPYATLTVSREGKTKSVNGSMDRPKPLLELEKLIRNIAEAHGLKVLEGVNPNTSAPPKGEVILKLRPEENAGNWIARFGEVKLRLVRRLHDNTWLVDYDPAQIGEKQVIELLKSTAGALEVQANHPVEDRH